MIAIRNRIPPITAHSFNQNFTRKYWQCFYGSRAKKSPEADGRLVEINQRAHRVVALFSLADIAGHKLRFTKRPPTSRQMRGVLESGLTPVFPLSFKERFAPSHLFSMGGPSRAPHPTPGPDNSENGATNGSSVVLMGAIRDET